MSQLEIVALHEQARKPEAAVRTKQWTPLAGSTNALGDGCATQATGHRCIGQCTTLLRLSHHSPRFQPTQVASARLSAMAEPKRSAVRCITAIPTPKPIRPQRLFAITAAVGGPPMRGCRISIMLVNTSGTSAMTPLIVGPTQPESVTTVPTSVATSAARNGISYQRRVISGILT